MAVGRAVVQLGANQQEKMALQCGKHFISLGISINKLARTHLTVDRNFHHDVREISLFPRFTSSLVEDTRDI